MDEREQLLPLLVAARVDNSLNIYILHSFRFHCVLSRFLIEGEGTYNEERNVRFSFSTPK